MVAIASVSGGGKTTIALEICQLLTNAAQSATTLHFDDYDLLGPNDICDWVSRGADYAEWDLTPLVEDLRSLGFDSKSADDYLILDYPFSYLHKQLKQFIDLAVFIATPLDIAMVRRLLRDYEHGSIGDVRQDLQVYLTKARPAYVHMEQTVKPTCDVVVDGARSPAEIAKEVKQAIHSKGRRL